MFFKGQQEDLNMGLAQGSLEDEGSRCECLRRGADRNSLAVTSES